MKAVTLTSLLLAMHGSLAAPVPASDDRLAGYDTQTITIVRVSRHRGALDSFIASEEVSRTLKMDEESRTRTDDSIDNSLVDLDGLDISAPSPLLDTHQPLPTSFLLALTHAPEGSEPAGGSEKETPEEDLNWAMALLRDVYADYRSVSPCWRQDGDIDATTRIQRLVQGKADMMVIAGVACIVMFILVLEALFTAIRGLRRSLIDAGAIRLEGPERILDSKHEFSDEKTPLASA